ncbi:unnamed protein product, partial [Mycena citricolor]
PHIRRPTTHHTSHICQLRSNGDAGHEGRDSRASGIPTEIGGVHEERQGLEGSRTPRAGKRTGTRPIGRRRGQCRLRPRMNTKRRGHDRLWPSQPPPSPYDHVPCILPMSMRRPETPLET